MAFLPVAKFAALAIKQVSKPIAKALTTSAKNSPAFSRWLENLGGVIFPFGIDGALLASFRSNLTSGKYVDDRMALGLDTTSKCSTISKEKAISDGSEFLGEGILFAIAVGATAWEYKSSNDKAIVAKAAQAEKERELLARVTALEDALARVEARQVAAVAVPSSESAKRGWF
eukprot:CAMPEP_0113711036 /NCGR_PEP_ID=MMETSP0038_2-20120614/30517_1 /TAXON_ID=2898 /ORGANISM="Cryptomonas paramecium" /LENGTH=172 /DNA_ID=CAMNT_0000637215 /DNA_START=39 /DNA_END=558 /DNA_ORIENTATION=+ /assembly_acc=CAM_ASM_000170